MNAYAMVAFIVLVIAISRVLRTRYESMKALPAPDNRENQALRDEVRTLKERVAVLERLATDDNSSVRLDLEIERLRDRS